jgi:hypothetical protein
MPDYAAHPNPTPGQLAVELSTLFTTAALSKQDHMARVDEWARHRLNPTVAALRQLQGVLDTLHEVAAGGFRE